MTKEFYLADGARLVHCVLELLGYEHLQDVYIVQSASVLHVTEPSCQHSSTITNNFLHCNVKYNVQQRQHNLKSKIT